MSGVDHHVSPQEVCYCVCWFRFQADSPLRDSAFLGRGRGMARLSPPGAVARRSAVHSVAARRAGDSCGRFPVPRWVKFKGMTPQCIATASSMRSMGRSLCLGGAACGDVFPSFRFPGICFRGSHESISGHSEDDGQQGPAEEQLPFSVVRRGVHRVTTPGFSIVATRRPCLRLSPTVG